jgi:MoxR-like ATPase
MGFKDIADPNAVVMAIKEFDSFDNPDDFLQKYGFGPATSYLLHFQGNDYPPRAILAVAHKFQFPEIGPLANSEFSGGEATTNKALRDLGFEVRDAAEKIKLFTSVRRIARGNISGLGKAPHKPLLLLAALRSHAFDQSRLRPIAEWVSDLQPLLDKAIPGRLASPYQPIWSLESEIWTVEINGQDVRPFPTGEPNLAILHQESVSAGFTQQFKETIDRLDCREELYELVLREFLSDLPLEFRRELQAMSSNRTTWWVNQGTTYAEARDAGHVWAPLLQKNGHAASHHSVLAELQIGDSVIHYSNGAVRALGLVTSRAEVKPRPVHHPEKEWEGEGRQVSVRYFELSNPIPLSSIKRIPAGEGPFNRNGSINQGYMYRLPEHWAKDFYKQFSDRWPVGTIWPNEVFEMTSPLDLLAKDLLLDVKFLEEIEELLEDKKQVIFYGPPGAGKTYVALKLAVALGGGAEEVNTVEVVQFHPSYAYEDFVEGFRPTEDGAFKLRRGKLLSIADRAIQNPDKKFFLIIDEINRGNVAKVFGEMYFLLEYRDRDIQLQYSDEPFRMPENLYFIGTMNSADRSIGLIDSALRRRFHFVSFYPTEDVMKNLLRDWLEKNAPSVSWIATAVDNANRELGNPDFAIGPSHFMKKDLTEDLARKIWRRSIIPYVEDFFFNQKEKAKDYDLDRLRALKRAEKDFSSADVNTDVDTEAS